MAESTATSEPVAATATQLEGQTYEIIRNRLAQHGRELRERLDTLNANRKEVFGSIETELLSTERVTTDNNCVPRDLIAIGNQVLLGYNVHIGLRSETRLSDVFATYQFQDRSFSSRPLELLSGDQFAADFHELYKYYKNTRFAKFSIVGPHLFMVFRVGKNVEDVKTFKWRIDGDTLKYVDNRSDYEFRFPPQHEFEWTRTTRDQHHSGLHPHVSIEDRIFVETIGGDLTIKIENNTDAGEGIFTEPVDDPDQTLDDAEIYYAVVGNLILLRVRPYQEQEYRHIVYNDKVKQARRIDAIADACVLLPDDHGLIFSQGYYLQNGQYKTFDTQITDMVFEKRIRSPNGEDVLYVFFNRLEGTYVLLSYNLISQEVSTPMICSGFAAMDAGEFITFRHHDETQKHHALQVWQTPFTSDEFVPPAESGSRLLKIGNRDLVRGMAECHEILQLVAKEDSFANLYLDLVKQATDCIDSYFWIDDPEAGNLKEPLTAIRDAAQAAIGEFDKVVRVRENTRRETEAVAARASQAMKSIDTDRFVHVDDFVNALANLRKLRGEIISLRDLKYVDESRVDALETDIEQRNASLADRCVAFLLEPDSLGVYEQRVAEQHDAIRQIEKVAEAREIEERVGVTATELEMLIEVVSNLKVDDATQRTAIIDNISAIFSRVNQVRAELKATRQQLMSVEGAAEFASQLKLVSQAVVNYLDICDSPQACDEYLTKLMIQIEELEGRFAEFDDLIEQLTEKREEIYNAFEARKLQLVEARNRRANSLMKSAERILNGIRTRVESLESVSEINGYFAADLMIEKIRDIVTQLSELDDAVRADDIQGRLKTIREDAVRQLKDRQELFVDGQDVIQLGRHKFSVNVQPLDLTTVVRDDEMCFHLTGTSFFEAVTDQGFLASRDLWDQQLVSESADVYRAEYLSYSLLEEGAVGDGAGLARLREQDDAGLLESVQQFMAPRYSEGYIKGVHDLDAAKILRDLVELRESISLLRYAPAARALAWLAWRCWNDSTAKPLLAAHLQGFGTLSHLFPQAATQAECIDRLCQVVTDFLQQSPVADADSAREAGEYLFYVLTGGGAFAISSDAVHVHNELKAHLDSRAFGDNFRDSFAGVKKNLLTSFLLARDWVGAFLDEREADADTRALRDEVAQLLVEEEYEEGRVTHASLVRDLEGMVGTHTRIDGGRYRLNYNEFTSRLRSFSEQSVPRFQQAAKRKHELLEEFREDLRLEEFRPRVLTSFVRNRLIDHVYLPLIGDNLAKQMGSAGETTRTDRMGLLLLISPPGYGKTTLMEYIANRLGIIFMKINGPAIGHEVTSLDPAAAPNAAAREEVERLNLALEMGDNVMIYLDDIQHCHPELLQKFISLCDATRKIEGVYKGRSKTYDLRGRKVCVVMAGNPYTESGERFQIPDMLANRADTYNLGEIIGDNADRFEMSYLENSLTSNPTLNLLATKSPHDVHTLIDMAQGGGQDTAQLEGNFAVEEIEEMVATMRKLMRVRDVILSVNREYIRSAAQADDYRTEPAFKLQGSYRNMNRIAERVSPVMNDEELQSLIFSQYENDAQTLTSGAEANLLKFKELTGMLAGEEAARWQEIKRVYRENLKLRGVDPGDRFGQVVAQMSSFVEGLAAIRQAVAEGAVQLRDEGQKQQRQESQQIADKLVEFGDGVESLRSTIAQGLEKLGQMIDRPATAKVPIVTNFSPEASDLLTKFVGELQMANRAAPPDDQTPAAAPPYKIQIVNKVPRLFLSIIREQFQLMQQWMNPIAELTHANRSGLDDIRQQIDQALKNYEGMIEKLEDSE